MQHHTTSTCAFTEDGNSCIIATEQVNILLDPLEGHLLVQDPSINNTSLGYLI